MSSISGALLCSEDHDGSDELETTCVWFRLILQLALCILNKCPEFPSFQSSSSSRDVPVKQRKYCCRRGTKCIHRNYLKKWPGLAPFQTQSSQGVKRRKERKHRTFRHRRRRRYHRKSVELIQNDPQTMIVWALYVCNHITRLFQKQKRKKKRIDTVTSPSSVCRANNPSALKNDSEVSLFRGETIPTRNQTRAQPSNPPKESSNKADSGVATGTSEASAESKRKPEPRPDTSTLATGCRSQHRREDQKFSRASSHGAHQIPPNSILLIPPPRQDRVPPENSPELPPTHTFIFGEREEFKPAVSAFKSCLGGERNSWDDGLSPGPVDANSPQSSASAVKVR